IVKRRANAPVLQAPGRFIWYELKLAAEAASPGPDNEEPGAALLRVRVRVRISVGIGLSLGELEPPTRTALAVLFAFLHAAVAREITGAAEGDFQRRVVLG